MKNLNDIFSGAVLLCLCAVGAYEVSVSIAPSDGEVVGADALPTLALGGMALCGVFLILQGLLRNRPGRSWGNRSAVIKTLLFFGFFVMYLSGMIWLGDWLVEQSWFPWPHNGGFTISVSPTPGYANTEEGYAAYLAASGQGTGALRLSEIMAAETLFTAPNGALCDWIEIENTGAETADLSGMHLSDKAGEARYTFPEGTLLAPGAFTVVWCSGDGTEGTDYAAIRLAKAGESVILTDADGSTLDRIQTPFLADDTAYARVSGEWCVTNRPTPGYANTDEGYDAFAAERGFGNVAVKITEVCLRSETTLRDADGDYPDWIELYNAGTESVSLDGWYLSDDSEEPVRWRFPDITLAPGEYCVIFASGKNRTQGELHTDFALSAGECVVLTTPIGSTADCVELIQTEPDASLALIGSDWQECASPTPGKANG